MTLNPATLRVIDSPSDRIRAALDPARRRVERARKVEQRTTAADPAGAMTHAPAEPRAFRAQLGPDLILGLALAIALGAMGGLLGANLAMDYLAAHGLWPEMWAVE